MSAYIERQLGPAILQRLSKNPVVALLGPRQCGKSTLAKALVQSVREKHYLDLERPSDLNKLQDAEAFFHQNQSSLICLDEIQRAPDLFPLIRAHVDESGRMGQFLILGSSSPELIRQSSESLAGRIALLELTPFLLGEVTGEPNILRSLWLRGGYPRSFLAKTETDSMAWRLDFIRTHLERDIPALGFRIPPVNIDRFWRMCAHLHGQILNRSQIGESIGVSHTTIQKYLDLLSHTFMIRTLPPYEKNLKKRLIKSPKIYIRDSGLLHAMLGIEDHNSLFGHPTYAASWEGFALENILSSCERWRASYYRTTSGTEIDLVLEKGKHRIAVEFKASSSPQPNRGFAIGRQDVEATESWVVAPIPEAYPLSRSVMATPPAALIEHLRNLT